MPAILLSQIELTAMALIAMLLHAFRRAIGIAPLYLMLGMFFIVALVADSPQIHKGVVVNGMFGGLGYGMMWLPFLLVLILVYELEGTIAAHRFFLGLFVLLIGFLTFSLVILGNVDPALAERASNMEQVIFLPFLDGGVMMCFAAHLGACILLPMVYQAARNRHLWYSVSIFMAFCVFLVLNETSLALYANFRTERVEKEALTFFNWNMRLLSMGWLAILGHIYLFFSGKRSQGGELGYRRALVFFLDFFSYFHSTGRMRQSLAEWSDRYQIVMNNSSELVFLLDEQGKVINANKTASKLLGNRLPAVDFILPECFSDEQEAPMNWKECWQKLDFTERQEAPQTLFLQNLKLELSEGDTLEVDVNLSPASLDGRPIALLIARDMTIQHAEARKKQNIFEQSMHSQRLESIGQLAGGIAHDFNNLLHSMQANVETLQVKGIGVSGSKELLGNISLGCQRAAKLTNQLLGFARKGKYEETIIDVKQLQDTVTQLFLPGAKGITLKVMSEPKELLVRGDETQISQVFLNLLINSRDALEGVEGEKKIVFRAETARPDLPEWEFCPSGISREVSYICIRVRDNGCGIPEDVKKRMFDPFFTTKPVGKGTGMGLAMVYGSVINHHGWIHVTSSPGQGCDFAVFLPAVSAVALTHP